MSDKTGKPCCPNCEQAMNRLALPPEGGYASEFFWVCFNDDCPYFVHGWDWMWECYRVKSSYRLRIDPISGREAPLPVWSKTALRDRILD